MQKTERLAIQAIQEVADRYGLSTREVTGRAKRHIWLEGRGIKAKKTISSSPRSAAAEIGAARRWAMRLVRDLD